jgi:hypothetical protein
MAKVKNEPFLVQRGRIKKLTSPFFNMVERSIVVNCKATTLAEKSLGKAFLASEVALLRLAPWTQLIGWWFSEIENFRNVAIPVWEPL